jgi:hypothetical protein
MWIGLAFAWAPPYMRLHVSTRTAIGQIEEHVAYIDVKK